MYDWPETRVALNRFWSHFRTGLTQVCPNAPTSLDTSNHQEQWQRDDLLISQTCGYPLVTALPETTVILGTPTYNTPFCKNGFYASVLIVRKTDSRTTLAEFRHSTLAYNSNDSQSGFNSLRNHLIDRKEIGRERPAFFNNTICSGSHRQSIISVANADADICAIDPVSWALAQRHEKASAKLIVLDTTGLAPALPLICAQNSIPNSLTEPQWRQIVAAAYTNALDADVSAKDELFLEGLSYIPMQEYQSLHIDKLALFPVPAA